MEKARYPRYPSPGQSGFGPSKTQQHMENDCNMNNIIAKYRKTGILVSENGTDRRPQYGDFTTVPTYQEALDIINHGNEMFAQLPPQVRRRFDNDPVELLRFVGNESNYDEAVRLGLMAPKEEPKIDIPLPPVAAKAAEVSAGSGVGSPA